MTGREFVSEVRSLNKLISSDNNITDRVIFKIGKVNASLLIKRETNLRRLWTSSNIFTQVPCLEMEQVPLSECCDYTTPCTITRTVKEIPQISEGIFGLLIQSVYSPGLTVFSFATIERYLNILKLGLRNKEKYYWVHGKRIYTTNPNIEAINLSAYFDDDINIKTLSNCVKAENDDSCVNPLDRPMKIPSYLEKGLFDLVNETLNNTYFRHLIDTSVDLKDEEKS